MKLKNKLLPLVGIGAACAAVTPIALTSCKNNSGLVDLLQKYRSTITDIPGQDGWTQEKATETYFSNCKANPNIFVDDYYWSRSFENLEYNLNNVTALSSYQVLQDNECFSNVSFKKQTFEDDDDIWTTSFEKQAEYQFQVKKKSELSLVGQINRSATYTLTGSIKFNNAPIQLAYNQGSGLWYIDIPEYTTGTETDWNILWKNDIESFIEYDATLKILETYNDYEYETVETFKFKVYDVESFNEWLNVLADLGDQYIVAYKIMIQATYDLGYSHYLFNVTYKE